MKINEKLNVKKLIEYAEDKLIWVPEFQRPFEWSDIQILLLIDSLYRSYTISSILLWEGPNELARRSIGSKISDIKVPEDNTDEKVDYILDGQQRTTALVLAFTNVEVYTKSSPKRNKIMNIYWDSEYIGDEPEMRWIIEENEFTDFKTGSIISLSGKTEKELFESFGTRFVKLKHAYKWAGASENKIKILEYMNRDADMYFQYDCKVNELIDKILLRDIIKIPQDGTLEQVLEVFERINTRNTKLNIFDIMVAKTYRRIDGKFFELRSFIKLIHFDNQLRSDYFDCVDSLELDKVKLYLDDKEILALVTIILYRKFKAADILKLDTNRDLLPNYKLINKKINQLYAYVKQKFYINNEELYRYKPLLKFLTIMLVHFDEITVERSKFIDKWFWNTLLMNRYPGAQNERIIRDYELLSKVTDLSDTLDIMLRDNKSNFTFIKNQTPDSPEYFEAYYTNSTQQLYQAIRLLLRTKGAKDFSNSFVPQPYGALMYKLEEHHIFPINSSIGKQIKSNYESTKNDNILNNIANIAFLTKDTNGKISNSNPSEYLRDLENDYQMHGNTDEFENIMDSQFINAEAREALRNDDFEKFMFHRTRAILDQIESLCGNDYSNKDMGVIIDNSVGIDEIETDRNQMTIDFRD
ncbi:MAG TPA: DUF262 domain-containing protein [Candidatus Cloacimonadota bacterium]|nr:DUF262 domain-containing protein [Candidatus Cloacimonadota bacterium]